MDSDERDIFQFLKIWGSDFTNPKEVCRRAGSKKRFYKDPDWARPVLARMADRGILETDVQGRVRIKPVPKKKHGKQWVAPDIAKILKESGLATEAEGEGGIADDDFYDQL